MNGDPDEVVIGHAVAAREPGLPVIDARHDLLGHVLDPALPEGIEEGLRDLLRNWNRRRHRADHPDLHGLPDAPLQEVIVEQERALERGGRALVRVAQDPDQDRARIDAGERVA